MTTVTITFPGNLDEHIKTILKQRLLDALWPDEGDVIASYHFEMKDKLQAGDIVLPKPSWDRDKKDDSFILE